MVTRHRSAGHAAQARGRFVAGHTASPRSSDHFTAVVDGRSFQATESEAFEIDFFGVNLLFIAGCASSATDTTCIEFLLPATAQTGTYELGSCDSCSAQGLYVTKPDAFWFTDSVNVGTLTITSIERPDGKLGSVQGVFSFDAFNDSTGTVVQVRSGDFSVSGLVDAVSATTWTDIKKRYR